MYETLETSGSFQYYYSLKNIKFHLIISLLVLFVIILLYLKTYAASLRSSSQLNTSYLNRLILDLGLKKAEHTRVGDTKTRGISGGEKKRLSIGNELALGSGTSSRLIFADEYNTISHKYYHYHYYFYYY